LVLALCILPASIACSSRTDLTPDSGPSRDADPPSDAGPSSESGASDATACSAGPALANCPADAIVAIEQAVDNAEVSMAEAVRPTLQDPKAIAYAEKMITDHTLLLEQLGGVFRAEAITATENGIARTITSMAAARVQSLSSDAGEEDSVYLDSDLLFHLQSLALLDRLTLPSSTGQSSLVRFAIESMHSLEEQHVELAVAVASSREGACGGHAGTD
jgi:predicted outer membrane protein